MPLELSSDQPTATLAPRPVVSIIIISYNTRQMTLDCLQSLYADLNDLPAEVFVVDNASSDGSATEIARTFPGVRVLANQVNVGFGAANNQAMRIAQGQFIMLLNSDAFPKLGTTRVLVEYLQAHSKVGVVGPKLLNADGSKQQSCYRFPTPGLAWRENLWISAAMKHHPRWGDYRHWAHDAERTVDWIVGACMLLRREVFDKVGGFDERFFMYAEETDWQRQIRDAGWEISFTPAAQVTHLGGASGANEKAKVNRYFFDSLDRYELKHHGVTGLLLLRLAMALGCSMRAIAWAVAFTLNYPNRARSSTKVRLNLWLVQRQLTHWRTALAGANLK